MKLKLLTLPALLAAAALSVPVALAKTPQDTLVIGKSADPQNLDPAVTMDNNDWTVTYPAYQRLVRYKVVDGKSSSELEGDLALGWTASADGLNWEFKLKPGQRFADGSPVDAAAVKFSFDRLLALKKGPSEPIPEGTQITVVDPATVRFTLKSSFAPFLSVLAINGGAIVNPKVMQHEKNGDKAQGWLAANTMGSGAYQLTSWQKGQSLVLDKSPQVNGAAPAFNKFIVKIVPEASARRLQLQAGDLDIAEHLPTDQVEGLKKQNGAQGVVVGEYPSLSVTYLYLNNKKAPLDKPEVRRAIVSAIDVGGIIDGILSGKAKAMNGPIPEGMWGHDAQLKPAAYAPAAAKEALAKAGVRNLKLTFSLSERDPAWNPIALATQANLAAIGVDIKLESMANATYRERFGKGDFDIAIGNWAPDFSDPYMFMNYWFQSDKQGAAGNRSFYGNPQVDALLTQAANSTSQPERLKLYQEAQRIVVGDAAYVYLFQKNIQIAQRANLKGLQFNPMLEQIYNVQTMSKSN
ncbi:ABC transporter substrate-binding protein [Xenophilus sp. Marseille-Q4582]|uniref:ABC transporter substrate-binding protein n=1 Tax=Xenophilus sp. Marseille-Q4582 TaxID=2866600 RepID=UPI001CE3DE4B|nr:ABC transporter substrate-binding protein [Xenophilus sp. Marseille-Q4582]